VHVNLLPSSFTWRRLISKRVRQWGWMFGLLTIAVLGWNAHLFAKWLKWNLEIQQIFAIAKPIREMQSDRLQLADQAAELEKKIKQLNSALAQDRTCSVLGIIAQGVRATNSTIQIQEAHFSMMAKPNDSAKPTREPQRSVTPQPSSSKLTFALETDYQISMRGVAVDGDSITEFVKSIQQSSAFPRVELRSTQERIVSERLLQEFQLECLSHE
jgi:hypothetical protein